MFALIVFFAGDSHFTRYYHRYGTQRSCSNSKEKYPMDFALSEEHRMVQQMVRDFAQKEVAPDHQRLRPQAGNGSLCAASHGGAWYFGYLHPGEVRWSGHGLHFTRSCLRGAGSRRYHPAGGDVGSHGLVCTWLFCNGERKNRSRTFWYPWPVAKKLALGPSLNRALVRILPISERQPVARRRYLHLEWRKDVDFPGIQGRLCPGDRRAPAQKRQNPAMD